MGIQALAFGVLSTRLGWRKRAVQFAALAYGSGFLTMTGAALISGFVIPAIGLRYDGGDSPDLEALRYVFAACVVGNRVLASFAAVATSLAIVLWSSALHDRGPFARALAALGLIVGAFPAVAILAGAMHLEVAGA
jgi:hypothetical protein